MDKWGKIVLDWAIAIAVLVVAGAAFYWLYGKAKVNNANAVTIQNNNAADQAYQNQEMDLEEQAQLNQLFDGGTANTGSTTGIDGSIGSVGNNSTTVTTSSTGTQTTPTSNG